MLHKFKIFVKIQEKYREGNDRCFLLSFSTNGAVTSENVSIFFYLDVKQCPNKLINDFYKLWLKAASSSFSWVKIKLHTEIQPPKLLLTALKVSSSGLKLHHRRWPQLVAYRNSASKVTCNFLKSFFCRVSIV